MRAWRLRIISCLVLLAVFAAPARATTNVADVRLWSGPDGTRVVLDLSAPPRYKVFSLRNPDRVVIDLADAKMTMRGLLPAGQGPVYSIRTGPQAGGGLRVVLDVKSPLQPKSFAVEPDGGAGHRLVIDLPPTSGRPVAPSGNAALTTAAVSAKNGALPAGSPASPVKSVALAAKGRDLVIAVDAGHGGKDPGAIGRSGTQEKKVTLAIARRLAAEINAENGMRAVLVRDGDYFISLRGRIAKARKNGADMFVSIHADSVGDRRVSGSSVYVLSLRGASDEASRWLAQRENAADLMGGVSLDDKNDVLASVLMDVTQKESVSDSVEAADNVLNSLQRVGRVHGKTVRHAGFVVLKSPDIPSMLVETAFISNSTDENRLRDPSQQKRIAQAIHKGVRNYFYDNPPPGTKLAALVAANRGGGGGATQTLAGR